MTDAPADSAYRVLARKYRPLTFADLVGQEAMVRTLRNAFDSDRIAHAFILTGVRGVGKTTTARIIAKGLNCVGADGTGGPTIEPCGVCDACRAIAEGRHVDVLEMDAASRTGVGDIREIIDSVAYRAASARYKVYIIDEVHMLSTSAFNALLKTLEEPPAHVKFIFATTEIRKVPVTVLSRCQRFDLRRIEPETMMGLLSGILATEGVGVAPDALALIVRAAEGSARDALSLLDQAIAHGAGETGAAEVRAMLGIADRGRVLDLFEAIMRGDARAALAEFGAQYAEGADPMAVMRDLAEITHWVSMVRLTPEAAEDPTIGPDERARGLDFAGRLGMRALTRTWQMLLKALEEVGAAPNAMMAAEMAIIRLTHVADLPSPEELVRRLSDAPAPAPAPPAGPGGGGGRAAGAPAALARPGVAAPAPLRAPAPVQAPVAEAEAGPLARYAEFSDVIALIRARRDLRLLIEVENGLRLVHYAPGRIEFEPAEEAEPDLAARLSQRLRDWTGARWGVSVVGSGGGATLAEQRDATKRSLRAEAAAHPLVQALLAAFPGAEIKDVRPPEAPLVEPEAEAGALAEDDDDWDPFAEE
ncbi:DNA polymerase III subunit gamma/tau [Amaricoccus solimangrovi]|uniref:DNA polymerase III subunit gamma/tau n=1 Tax=Amaricoccus solimangrovi TaxID=2589815 RepID=A0A501WDV7_9RHOB|nr:DNA polymerase III subunit gamma/tau [Amaricoccus solimangrovi]TPE46580.1 DNA polymerase III subunit gamma/tau [Amaricoccus solimangrovi]